MQDFDRADLDQSMVAFEAAVSATKVELPALKISSVLAAIDGSNQDATTLEMASSLARSHEAALYITYAYGGEDDPERNGLLSRTAAELNASAVRRTGGSPAQQLAQATRQTSASVLVAGAPYLEDYRELGTASLGTHLDVVLNRREQPVLVVREPVDDPRALWATVFLPLNLVAGSGAGAASWALAMARTGSSLVIVAVADTEIAESLRGLFPDDRTLAEIDEERLAGLVQPEIAGLISAVQQGCAEHNATCQVIVRAGPAVQAVTSSANQQSGVVVTTCTSDCTSTGYQRVQALIRASRNPVLVV